MNRISMYWKHLAVVLLLLTTGSSLQAQTALDKVKREMDMQRAEAARNGTTILPDITTSFSLTEGALIKWFNQYDFIRSIAVQKSDNKDVNFKTIAYLEDNKKGVGQYFDQNINYGTSYYRLLIVFGTDMNWYSNVSALTIDSSSFIQFYEKKGQTADFSNAYGIDSNSSSNFTNGNFSSNKVYYDLYDQQIHVNLHQDWNTKSQYSLVVKDPRTNRQLAKINKLPQSKFILDPKNFNEKGMLQFELYKDKVILEQGYINIQ